jgi:hypothetical protein
MAQISGTPTFQIKAVNERTTEFFVIRHFNVPQHHVMMTQRVHRDEPQSESTWYHV